MSNKFVPENTSSVLTNPAMEFLSEDTIKKIDDKKGLSHEKSNKENNKKDKKEITNYESHSMAKIDSHNIPEGYKINPQYIEKKIRRVSLYLQPSVYERLHSKVKKLKIPMNEYLHRLIEKDIEGDE